MSTTTYRDWRIVRFAIGRRRLLLSLLAGIILLVVLPERFRTTTRYILAWDLAAVLYIASTLWMISRSTVSDCHDRAALYDEGDWIILILVIASALASFVCIAVELPVLKSPEQSTAIGIAVTGLTVASSWTFTHLVFTLHYANVYYKPDEDGPGGLVFPGNRAPDYRDFLYYSFVIGCAAQTGDVGTVSPAMRHLTLIHGIVAFSFNTAILALTINVGASLLQ
jgi:uncharacterized membrane protein